MSPLPFYAPKIKLKKLSKINENHDIDDQTYKHALELVIARLEQSRYWAIDLDKLVYDSESKLLWFNSVQLSTEYNCEFEKIQPLLKDCYLPEFFQWRLPTSDEAEKTPLTDLPLTEDNKLINLNRVWHQTSANVKKVIGIKSSIASGVLGTTVRGPFFGVAAGFAIGNALFNSKAEQKYLLPVSDTFETLDSINVIDICLNKAWFIYPLNLDPYTEESKEFIRQRTVIEDYLKSQLDQVTISEWQNIDYLSTRLPAIDTLRFTDVNQGMWEFYTPEHVQNEFFPVNNPDGIRARNPELDIRNAKVAIDFGTSSTVVAIRNNGRDELLRIGLQEVDFNKNEVTEKDFENPTVLEFLDIKAFKKSWHSEAYRPLVDWSDVHCSHEAQNRLRQNDTDTVIVGSMLLRLKQWALRDEQQTKVRITDSTERHEFEFDHLKELNPTKGQPIYLEKDYPDIDPIELYAWFLGMNINWRERGIYLNYYLTFPVAYPADTKSKILASFRRGLQRSLPQSLIYSERFNDFSVSELASEPAAFAAAALPTLQIEPTEEGVPYAVFDFGGGTTDFDYGIYRLPDDDELDEGWDDVIEHFGSSGDKFLGGENLIENLAYLVFKENQDTCREKQVTFTKPIDAEAFVGSERLISNSQSALTNTTIIMSKLRPYWEDNSNQENREPLIKVRLLDRNNNLVDCELTVNKKNIDKFLYERLHRGLLNFFAAMKASYDQHLNGLPEEIHVLLAGNSSRSSILQKLLQPLEADTITEDEAIKTDDSVEFFEDTLTWVQPYINALGIEDWADAPVFIFHRPLVSHKDEPYKPNTKTGVALG